MIAAKGWQSLISAGIYTRIGPLELQLQPEYVYAANPQYEHTPSYGSHTAAYHKLFPGQSAIQLSLLSLTGGLSTQNLWWGPGRFSSLLMSNNAPGFLHAFFRSEKPIASPVGSFEWQLIGAKLKASTELPYENAHLTSQPQSGSRYLSAVILTYHPKWIPGIFLGVTRALQRYRADIDKSGSSIIDRYFPVFTKAVQKQGAFSDDTMRTDQLASFFVRWAFFKARAELYAEYGLNDYAVNTRDYIQTPTHSAAYIVGFKKIVPLTGPDYVDLGIELTQMSQSPDYLVRDAGNWYIHSQVVEGYTNENQILGAGAGLGANVQTLTVNWVRNERQLGFLVERIDRDPVGHTYKWIDLSFGLQPQWKFGKAMVSGKIQFINSSQYAWQKDVNRFNLHSRIAVQYFF
ncbi:MAG: hypothetical protein JO301_07925 [Chitinophagaceae bacterium]|nr:hypothetical protein [Chitinophagaceae bacterium]